MTVCGGSRKRSIRGFNEGDVAGLHHPMRRGVVNAISPAVLAVANQVPFPGAVLQVLPVMVVEWTKARAPTTRWCDSAACSPNISKYGVLLFTGLMPSDDLESLY